MFIKTLVTAAVFAAMTVPALSIEVRKGPRPEVCDSYQEYAGFVDRTAARAALVQGSDRIVVKDSSYGRNNPGGYEVTFKTYGPGEQAPRHARSVHRILLGHNCS